MITSKDYLDESKFVFHARRAKSKFVQLSQDPEWPQRQILTQYFGSSIVGYLTGSETSKEYKDYVDFLINAEFPMRGVGVVLKNR